MKNEEFNIKESYGYHFNVIFINIKRAMEKRLRAYNVTHLQFSILINLYKNNLSTQKEILKYTNGDETSITRLIDRLETKGYLRRVQCRTDKRRKKILLTKEGAALTEKLITCAQDVNGELIKDLTPGEADELLKLLQKVSIAMQAVS